MAQVVVGTTAVALTGLDRAGLVIQNLGPGTLYIDTDAEATVASGLRLAVNEALTISGSAARETGIWLIASAAATDVRVVRMGEKN